MHGVQKKKFQPSVTVTKVVFHVVIPRFVSRSIFISPKANAVEIKEKVVRRHANHDEMIYKGLDCTLLYSHGRETIFLPGTSNPFMLEKYRENVGLSYDRITLYIAIKSDIIFSKILDFEDLDDEDETNKEEGSNLEDDTISEESVHGLPTNSGVSTNCGFYSL